jgi:hypothetical protein
MAFYYGKLQADIASIIGLLIAIVALILTVSIHQVVVIAPNTS